MRAELCSLLVCPDCRADLHLEVDEGSEREVVRGGLCCRRCGERYAIERGIPRFGGESSYVDSFGWQWRRFRRTQLDAFSGTDESARRFRAETEWRPDELRGLLVLDAGCGAGRFSAVASGWGARVVAVDFAAGAAEACAQNMGELGLTVDVVQASLYRLPFRPESFDRIFSLGVLQHTPDPAKAMRLLPHFLKPGGQLAYWIYERRWTDWLKARNYLRGLSRRLPRPATYALSLGLTALFFPWTLLLSRLPLVRRGLPLAPISSRHYWGRLSLREQWEWTLLDTFDSYSAVYEHNQREADVVSALRGAGMEAIRRTPARGMAIVARKPAREPAGG